MTLKKELRTALTILMTKVLRNFKITKCRKYYLWKGCQGIKKEDGEKWKKISETNFSDTYVPSTAKMFFDYSL